jgi:cellulose synthase/poly-beta-1,6-N-acetylglucosamine synthase-like glycosyltransferase
MTTDVLRDLFVVVSLLLTTYFTFWAVSQFVMAGAAVAVIYRHDRRYTRRARRLASDLAAQPAVSVSIVVPAHNEAFTVVESVRALLALEYESSEIVVVNDGSTDGTLGELQRAFRMIPGPLAFAQPVATEPIRGVYRSAVEPRLVVVDKENGGSKADAVNAGINAATGALVLTIDADTILVPDALNRAVVPFVEDGATVAVGANIAIVNGCHVERGRLKQVGLPASWFAMFQIAEYMRAFMLLRLACAACNGVVVISGAFGLFRRDAVIAVGGYDRTAIGEDMDLTVRLQRYFRARGERFRIAFDPLPLGWTQAPEDWRSLKGQRIRWRRGLLQVLWRYRGMIGNPRYGVVGLSVLPYYLVFEGISPVLELAGYLVVIAAILAGLIDWPYSGLILIVPIVFGGAVGLLSILIHDLATRNYMRWPELVRLFAAAVLENCGYRQLNSWWIWLGTVKAMSGSTGWGDMKRKSFDRAPTASASSDR